MSAEMNTNDQLAHIITLLEQLIRSGDSPRVAPETPKDAPGAEVSCQAAIDAYVQEKSRENSPQHVHNSKLILARYAELSQATTISTAGSKASVRGYKSALMARKLSNSTVNQHLAVLSGFFSWCVSQDYIDANPVSGLSLKNGKAPKEQRRALSEGDIELLFSPSFFQVVKRQREYTQAKKWLPLIMLYSGARPEEVAQLQGPLVEGDCFDFATLEEGIRRKNEASRRLVPCHSKLFELGIEEIVKRGRWFPTLNAGSTGRLARQPSVWFNTKWLRPRIPDRRKVLYSLRHSFTTALKVTHRIDPSIIAQIVGHSDSSMTTGRYGKDYNREHLKDVIERLEWPVKT